MAGSISVSGPVLVLSVVFLFLLLPLCELAVLAPALFPRTCLLLCLVAPNDSSAAIVAVLEDVELVGEELPRYLAVLGARACGLGFYDYARGLVEELDCTACLVLFWRVASRRFCVSTRLCTDVKQKLARAMERAPVNLQTLSATRTSSRAVYCKTIHCQTRICRWSYLEEGRWE